jgi:ankyrin repeat protein
MSFQKTIRNIRPAVEFLGSSVTTVEKQSIPLLELIETFRSWNATKAIDKVYALLNFSSDAYNEPTLQPDYTISEHLLASRLVQFAFPECTMEPHGDQQSNAVTFEIEGLVLGTINGKWSGKDNMRSWTFQTKIYSKQSQPPDLTFNARVLELFEHQWQIDILSEHRLDIDYYVCLLRGASRPTVLRYNDGKFTVAMMATPPPTPWSNEVRVDQGSYRHVVQDTAAFTEKRPPLPVLRMTWSDVVDALSKEIEGTMKFKLTWDPFRQPTSDEVKRYIPTPNNWQIQREARHESFRDMAVLKREAGELEEIFTCENLSMLNITFRHDEEKIKNGTSKWTITLHDAARRGLLGTLRILLDASAEVDKVDSDGLTALHLAARNGHTRIVEALLKAKATPNASHNVVWTPLHLAVRNNHNNICQLLLDYGASPNAGDDMTPPLFDAVLFRQSSIVSTLLNAGANPNTVQQVADDLRDVTALHLAAELGLTDIVKLLLAAGARTDAVTSSGMLPLHQATMDGHTDTVLLLLDAGSDINAMDGQGVTPLDFAIHGGHERTAEEIRLRGGVHKILEAMPWD